MSSTTDSSAKSITNLDQMLRQQCQILFQNSAPANDPGQFQKNSLMALKNIHQLILPRDVRSPQGVYPEGDSLSKDESLKKR
mmetsp:Transcript_2731/g.4655  ORF Transcript_2731/g.4655 Transcript_2731/m.4655 type:complete len:82 (+) Transcript_2731:892-1137(+)